MASSSLSPNPARDLISKSIDKVRDTDVPAPWPAECAECDAVPCDRADAERHRSRTEHELVVVQATDHDMDLLAVIDAYRRPVN
jgi:hypothetical protein